MQQPPSPPPPSTPPPSTPPPYAPTASWSPPTQPAGPAPGIRYASSGARLVAYIVDGLILGVLISLFYFVGFIVLVAGASVNGSGNASFGAGVAIGIVVIVVGVIVAVFWKPWFWSHGGQTPGYKMLGMRLVRAVDGGPVSSGTAILRLIGYVVSGMILDLGFIWILFDSRHQGWHDKIASTVVIQS